MLLEAVFDAELLPVEALPMALEPELAGGTRTIDLGVFVKTVSDGGNGKNLGRLNSLGISPTDSEPTHQSNKGFFIASITPKRPSISYNTCTIEHLNCKPRTLQETVAIIVKDS